MAAVTRVLTNAGDPFINGSGNPLAGIRIEFYLMNARRQRVDAWDVLSGELVAAGPIHVFTNNAGEFSVPLWPTSRGDQVLYWYCHVDYDGSVDFFAPLVDGVGPVQWIDFKFGGVAPTPTQYDVLTAHIADANLHFNWRGDYVHGTPYIHYDAVQFAGSTWKAKVDNVNIDPPDDPATMSATWALMAAKGDQGPAGPGTSGFALVSSYASLTAAVAAIGATPLELLLDVATTCTANTTAPATLAIRGTKKGTINQGAYTLTINGPFEAGLHSVFTGSGAVTLNRVRAVPPQWFGAVCNSSITTYANDCSAAFAKMIAAGGVCEIPPGYYYISAATMIDRSKVINLAKGFLPGDTFEGTFVERTDRAVIYTDQDIDFFVIKSRNVWIDGGAFDASGVTAHTKAVFRYVPPNTTVTESKGMKEGGITNFHVRGNKATLKNVGNGTTAILIDWPSGDNNAYLYRHRWQGYCEYVKYGFYEIAANTGGKTGQSTSSNHMDFSIWGAKQAIVLPSMYYNNIKLFFQAQYGLDASETSLPVLGVYTPYNRIEALFWDLGKTPDGTYGSSNQYSIEDTTGKNYYERRGLVDVGIKNRLITGATPYSMSHIDLTGSSGFLAGNKNNSIYSLKSVATQNALVAADKRFTVAIGYFQKPGGVAFTDITTDSATYGASTTANVSGANTANLFNPHMYPTAFTFNGSAAADDYVEIAITGIGATLRLNELFLQLGMANTGGIRQIHVVTVNGAGTVYTNQLFSCNQLTEASLTQFYHYLLTDTAAIDKLIIRLIGSFKVNDPIYVYDLAGFSQNTPTTYVNAPLIDIAGGQQIFGPLTVAGTTASPADLVAGTGAWNGTGLLRLGNYRLWIDASGRLRVKNGAPTSDTDGTIVGTQS